LFASGQFPFAATIAGKFIGSNVGFKAQHPFVPRFFRTTPTEEDGRSKE